MGNQDEAKEQLIDELIDELIELRRRIIELEASGVESKQLYQMSGVKIGEILVEMGVLTISELRTYLRRQKTEVLAHLLDYKQRRIGEILMESGVITEEQLRGALEEQRIRLRPHID